MQAHATPIHGSARLFRAGRVLYGSLSRCFVHRMDLACAAGKIESFADLVSM